MAAGDLTATIPFNAGTQAAFFDGVDDYIEIPHHANQLGANLSNGFTISAWINPRSGGELNEGIILDKSSGTAGNEGFKYSMSNDNQSMRINNGITKYGANNSVPYKVWAHVLVTVSAAQLANFYDNGVLSGAANQDLVQGISAMTTTNVMRIGNISTATTRTFDGLIRDVRMYNRVLTATEITNLSNGVDVFDGLIGHWKLKGDATDSSQFANNGTATGALFIGSNQNILVADAAGINLAATTDKLIAIPIEGRGNNFLMIGVNRAAA